ncbi:Fe2OG dioxygenase domain-containing protein [Mycena kentingensis (nom. inval.)]|nr:Fe2OG dioxygenase domain-containing protein [Mycena kentingensis (nom. inval.)]
MACDDQSQTSPPTIPDARHHIQNLRESLAKTTPYTSGVLPVRDDDLALYFKTGPGEGDVRTFNFTSATDEQLTALATACSPATFGVDAKDVLDERYRKAGKMDCSQFAASLDIGTLQLLEIISPHLLDGQSSAAEDPQLDSPDYDSEGEEKEKELVVKEEKTLRAELYKLNVYGPGSFFKEHKDTPRSEDMIGSLVLVYPTAHKGGALTLSHDGAAFKFDSATELAETKNALAYVAFFSDVTHAVEEVLEGYRVTLTYNLYLGARRTAAPQASAADADCAAALRGLVHDTSFLPHGGLLGFGLRYQYPIPRTPEDRTALSSVLKVLKGPDARIHGAATLLGLETRMRLLYTIDDWWRNEDQNGQFLADKVIDMFECGGYGDEVYEAQERVITEAGQACRIVTEEEVKKMKRKRDGDDDEEASGRGKKQKRDESDSDGEGDKEGGDDEDEEDGEERTALFWVQAMTKVNVAESLHAAFGNEASVKHTYGHAALFVTIPPAKDRGTKSG